nr:helix-turn-helix domain-containing protein [Bifidobacterium breve]
MVGSVQVHNQRESVALDMKAYSRLSAEERIRIDELRNREGLGVRQIALRISRGKSTVSREPRRGPWLASNENESYRPYRPKRLKTGASAATCPRGPVSTA